MLTLSHLQHLLEHALDSIISKLDCFYTVSISDLIEMPFSDSLFCINHYAQLSTISLGSQSVVRGDLGEQRIDHKASHLPGLSGFVENLRFQPGAGTAHCWYCLAGFIGARLISTSDLDSKHEGHLYHN